MKRKKMGSSNPTPIEIKFSGYSMYPSLRPGNILLIREVTIKEISPGDIVCIQKNDGHIAHRVVRIEREREKTTIITKGDNITRPDPPDLPMLETDCLIKRVVMIKRGKDRLIIPRYGKMLALLSRMNLTYGIMKGRGGRIVRSIFSEKGSIKNKEQCL
jgi:signal peptidase I